MQQSLPKETGENVIRLEWRIDGAFTAQAGELRLDLFACDRTDSPMQIIRYQLAPIQVREVPPPGEEVQSSEITHILARIQEEADKAVERIQSIQPPLAGERLEEMEKTVAEVKSTTNIVYNTYTSVSRALSELMARMNEVEAELAAIPAIVPLTADAYAALDVPDADTLYLVTENG